jgi:hypothetical protein
MAVSLLDLVRETMSVPRGGRPICSVCNRAVNRDDQQLRLRGGTIVHRDCATYDMRRRRTGNDRLGFPPRAS